MRRLQDLLRSATFGDPVETPKLRTLINRLLKVALCRDVHSRRYYASVDRGHAYRIDLIYQVTEEVVNFMSGKSASLQAAVKILKSYTAPKSPATLPPRGRRVRRGARFTPERVARALFG